SGPELCRLQRLRSSVPQTDRDKVTDIHRKARGQVRGELPQSIHPLPPPLPPAPAAAPYRAFPSRGLDPPEWADVKASSLPESRSSRAYCGYGPQKCAHHARRGSRCNCPQRGYTRRPSGTHPAWPTSRVSGGPAFRPPHALEQREILHVTRAHLQHIGILLNQIAIH